MYLGLYNKHVCKDMRLVANCSCAYCFLCDNTQNDYLVSDRGVHRRGDDARCVIEISGGGRKKSFEILYSEMQRPNDQKVYSTGMLQ